MTRIIFVLLLLSILTACGAPAYTPDAATLAEREAAAYEASVTRRTWVFYAVYIAVCIVLLILCGFVFFLAKNRYRQVEATAAEAEARVRRMDFIDLGGGKVYDIRTKTVINTGSTAPSEIRPPAPVAPLSNKPAQNGNPYLMFVLNAANAVGWRSKIVPRYDKMKMRAEEWVQITDVLVGETLIDKAPGRETVITEDRDLGQLYDLLTTYPIEDDR
jgi:hypothetical protein